MDEHVYVKKEPKWCGEEREAPLSSDDNEARVDAAELRGLEMDQLMQSSYAAAINLAHIAGPVKREPQPDETQAQPDVGFVDVDSDQVGPLELPQVSEQDVDPLQLSTLPESWCLKQEVECPVKQEPLRLQSCSVEAGEARTAELQTDLGTFSSPVPDGFASCLLTETPNVVESRRPRPPKSTPTRRETSAFVDDSSGVRGSEKDAASSGFSLRAGPSRVHRVGDFLRYTSKQGLSSSLTGIELDFVPSVGTYHGEEEEDCKPELAWEKRANTLCTSTAEEERSSHDLYAREKVYNVDEAPQSSKPGGDAERGSGPPGEFSVRDETCGEDDEARRSGEYVREVRGGRFESRPAPRCHVVVHSPKEGRKKGRDRSDAPLNVPGRVTDRRKAEGKEKAALDRQDQGGKAPYACSTCEASFGLKSALSEHRLYTHDARETPYSSDKSEESASPAAQRNGRYTCDECKASFNHATSLSRHERTHSAEGRLYTCDECKASFNHATSLSRHKRTHSVEGRLYACDECEATFVRRHYLTRHERRHAGVKLYACDVCEARFTESSDLIKHKRVHTGVKPFRCDLCEARFTQSGTLTIHRRRHTGEKPYACDACDAKFVKSQALTQHKRLHTGEKRYACEVCDVGFTQKSSLTKHKQLHAGAKPYGCEVCDAKFAKSQTLAVHKRLHTGEKPYACDGCDARFSQRSTLSRHKEVHRAVKRYACNVCNARFAQSDGLRKHMRCHTGERPYACDVCDARFTQRSNLNVHKRRHTGEK